MGIATTNEELLTQRDFARAYPRHLRRLRAGEIDKLVITTKGKMEAVVLTVEEYEKLTDGKS